MEMKMQEQETKRSFGTVNFERRKHPRWAIDLPVEYGPIGSFKSRPGRTGDLSEGGLLLYLPEEMEVGQDLWVKLFMGTERELKSIEARVQVVWKDFYGGEKNDFRRVGVKITDISPEDMGKLENFLRTLIIRKATPELNIPPRLLSALGLSNLKIETIDD
jgi:c-di-GMP-binding flagellar brake protein YcgR